MKLTVEQIAEVCHETNKVYCRMLGDHSQKDWPVAPENIKASAVAGVKTAIDLGAAATPEKMHQAWVKWKMQEGWVYGEVKDAEKKTHPCLKPYAELPEEQRLKDLLFVRIVKTLTL